MARRNYECRCCERGCDRCDKQPIALVANVVYPTAGGQMIAAGTFQAGAYDAISTKCEADPEGNTITAVRLLDSGSGYTSVPTFTIAGGGGTVTDATLDLAFEVDSVTLTSGGSGYLQTPSVFPINAFADVRGPIVSVSVDEAGDGYEEPPIVEFSGGTGAAATAKIDSQGKVTSITVTNGGSNYPPSPPVHLFGGNPKSAATASATISGSVQKLELLDEARYLGTRKLDGSMTMPPTAVSFVGNGATPAAATISYTGAVAGMTAVGKGFSSPPSITVSGGGGSGASLAAELRWQASHTRQALISSCFAEMSGGGCLTSQSGSSPPFALECTSVFSRPENVSWSARVATDPEGRRSVDRANGVLPAGVQGPFIDESWFLPGEAIWAATTTAWSTPGKAVVGSQEWAACDTPYLKDIETHQRDIFVRRFYSRVPPSTEWTLVSPDQGAATENATMLATYTQYVDAKGDSIWYLEDLQLDSNGTNLYFLGSLAFNQPVTFRCANSRSEVLLQGRFTRTAPQADTVELIGFSVQPNLSVSFLARGDGIYEAQTVTIVHGGQTTLPNGTLLRFVLPLAAGHAPTRPPQLVGFVSSGRLASVSFADRGDIYGPAALTSVTSLISDPLFNRPERFLAGESANVCQRVHEQPTLTGAANMQAGGDGGLFSVTTEQATDANGDTYWRVTAAAVVTQPTGFYKSVTINLDGVTLTGAQLLIEPVAPAIEAVPALVFMKFENQSPVASAFEVLGGFSLTPMFDSFSLEEFTDFAGAKKWRLTGGALTVAGADVEGFAADQVLTVTTQLGSTPFFCDQAKIKILAVDGNGRITDWEIANGGEYYLGGGPFDRVVVLDGGKYFKRTITETDQELPAEVACVGEISTANGWEKNTVSLVEYSSYSPDVNEGYQYFSQVVGGTLDVTRTRRCHTPTISLSMT